MRTLFLLLLTCLPCFGQFVAEQPIFATRSAAFTPNDIPSLAYYWKFTDLADGAVSSWADQIQGALLTQTAAAQRPTKFSGGVIFVSNDVLTNGTVLRTWATPAPGVTEYVIGWKTNYTNPDVEMIIDDLVGGGTSGWRLENSFMEVGSTSVGKNGGGANVFRDFLIQDSSVQNGTAWTNNVQTSATFNKSSDETGFALGNRYTGVMPFNGYILEVIIYTNVISATSRSNLHYYATNTYSFSP